MDAARIRTLLAKPAAFRSFLIGSPDIVFGRRSPLSCPLACWLALNTQDPAIAVTCGQILCADGAVPSPAWVVEFVHLVDSCGAPANDASTDLIRGAVAARCLDLAVAKLAA